jgi:hypothetical protein
MTYLTVSLYNLIFNNGCVKQPARKILENLTIASCEPAPAHHWIGALLDREPGPELV